MDMLDALSQTFDHTTQVMAGVDPAQHGAATPCTEWDVSTLVGHTIGVVVNMGRGAAGAELLSEPTVVDPGADLGSRFRTEADRTMAAWRERGTDGEVDIGAGPMPVVAALSVNLLDTATHSWDIATATGQAATLPGGLADQVLAVSKGFVTDQIREAAGFHDAVPVAADADATTQLVAFLGRRP